MKKEKDICEYKLEAIYDARQSFYGKAIIKEQQYDNFNAFILYSYGTEVASVEKYKNGLTIYYYNGKYSQTTTRHQKEFFKQLGLNNAQIKTLFDNGRLEVIF